VVVSPRKRPLLSLYVDTTKSERECYVGRPLSPRGNVLVGMISLFGAPFEDKGRWE
jgi:hypothetical protein